MLASLLSKASIRVRFLVFYSGLSLLSDSILLEKALMDFASLAANGFIYSMFGGSSGYI